MLFLLQLGACFSQLRTRKTSLTSSLSAFWNDMNKAFVAKNYSNTFFVTNIANQLSWSNVTGANNSNTNCGTFLASVKGPNPPVQTILSKSDYFGGFQIAGGKGDKPFLTGIVGTRRYLLPKRVFHILNRVAPPA